MNIKYYNLYKNSPYFYLTTRRSLFLKKVWFRSFKESRCFLISKINWLNLYGIRASLIFQGCLNSKDIKKSVILKKNKYIIDRENLLLTKYELDVYKDQHLHNFFFKSYMGLKTDYLTLESINLYDFQLSDLVKDVVKLSKLKEKKKINQNRDVDDKFSIVKKLEFPSLFFKKINVNLSDYISIDTNSVLSFLYFYQNYLTNFKIRLTRNIDLLTMYNCKLNFYNWNVRKKSIQFLQNTFIKMKIQLIFYQKLFIYIYFNKNLVFFLNSKLNFNNWFKINKFTFIQRNKWFLWNPLLMNLVLLSKLSWKLNYKNLIKKKIFITLNNTF